MKKPIRVFMSRAVWAITMLVVVESMEIASAYAAAQAVPEKTIKMSQGMHHVRRIGDAVKARSDIEMLLKFYAGRCESPVQITGNAKDIGKIVVDEYFSPVMKRSVRVSRKTLFRPEGPCKGVVEEQETRVITHFAPDGYTRYERKEGKSGQVSWLKTEHKYIPGLAKILTASVQEAFAEGTFSVSTSLGHETYAPGLTCEKNRVTAGSRLEFTSCIHATGNAFPSHIVFASEMRDGEKVVLTERFDSYSAGLALSQDLFYPPASEMTPPKKSSGSRKAADATSRWCMKEKARTGVDPCEDDDE